MKTLSRWILCLGLIASAQAWAQTAIPHFELERLHLDPAATNSLVNATGELLPMGQLRMAVSVELESGQLVLHDPELDLGARLTGIVSVAYALRNWLQLEAEIPVIGYQNRSNFSGTGFTPPAESGAGTYLFRLDLAPLQQRTGSGINLALNLGFGLPFSGSRALGRDDAVSFRPSLSLGRDFGAVSFGGQVGLVVRPNRQLTANPDDIAQSEANLGLTLAARFSHAVRGEIDLRGALGFKSSAIGGQALAALRFSLDPRLELYVAGGPGFGSLEGVPDVRAFIGLAAILDTKSMLQPGTAPAPVTAPAAPKPNACVAGQPHKAADCPELDDDSDGIPNGSDNCPLLAEDKDGYQDADGCPDLDNDGDGVADSLDHCPNKPGLQGNHGCPVVDQDHDGVLDTVDKCPTAAGPASNQGCPLPDADKDGVADAQDNCVQTPGPKSNHGCPAKQKQLVVIHQNNLQILDHVYFHNGSARLRRRSDRLLNQIARVLEEHPNIQHVEIAGYTDSVGPAKRNMRLSRRRAQTVRRYLIRRGVSAKRLTAKGYGETRPIESNATRAGREANRRVEFHIINPPATPGQK